MARKIPMKIMRKTVKKVRKKVRKSTSQSVVMTSTSHSDSMILTRNKNMPSHLIHMRSMVIMTTQSMISTLKTKKTRERVKSPSTSTRTKSLRTRSLRTKHLFTLQTLPPPPILRLFLTELPILPAATPCTTTSTSTLLTLPFLSTWR